jgi:hypothetical protein
MRRAPRQDLALNPKSHHEEEQAIRPSLIQWPKVKTRDSFQVKPPASRIWKYAADHADA